MSDDAGGAAPLTAWKVAPKSGFRVRNASGYVGLDQLDERQFRVRSSFRFDDDAIRKRLRDEIVRDGTEPAEADEMVERACTYDAHDDTDDDTDLASIPPFMRWFVNDYGRHTLAAIIHDRLIVTAPNAGALGSDTLTDTFFREMMRSAGVPWLKRGIMWAAVAMRSRWAAGGRRKSRLMAWVALAAVGITLVVWAAGGAWFGWGHPLDPLWMLAVALVLPFVAAPLWGRQYGAGLVAAAAALWILPAAVFGATGYAVYRLLERGASAIRLR